MAHHFLCTNKENDAKEIRRLAFFYLLRHFSTLNKKNSLCSNSFLFLTFRKAPALNGKKKRPELKNNKWRNNIAPFINNYSQRAKQCCTKQTNCPSERGTSTKCRGGEQTSTTTSEAMLSPSSKAESFRPQWRSVKKFVRFSVKKKKLFELKASSFSLGKKCKF